MTPDTRLGPYSLIEPVGKGGQASVWLAKDDRTGEVVALKSLRDDLRGPKEIARFRREAAILSTLRDPGLPACLHLIEQPEGVPVAIAMEYIKGTALSALSRQRRLSPREIRSVGCELARILAVIHAHELVHRDIKAANIILRQGWQQGVPGSVVLVDLGIAKGTSRHATSHTEPGFIVGSAGCLAPEILLRPAEVQRTSKQVDVFGVGVLLWFLIFGRHPTGLDMRADVLDLLEAYADGIFDEPDPELAAPIERSVPGLVDVARRCAAYEPAARYADAQGAHAALASLRSSGGNTKLYVEPAAVSYNVAIRPRPSPVGSSAGGAEGAPPPEYATLDLDSEAQTEVRLCPPPEPTADEPMSETIASLRMQFGEPPTDEVEDTEDDIGNDTEEDTEDDPRSALLSPYTPPPPSAQAAPPSPYTPPPAHAQPAFVPQPASSYPSGTPYPSVGPPHMGSQPAASTIPPKTKNTAAIVAIVVACAFAATTGVVALFLLYEFAW